MNVSQGVGSTAEAGRPAVPVQALLEILAQEGACAGGALFAVLDGARDPRVHRAALASGVPWACLYAGQLAQPLVEVAPYLVKLLPDHPFTEELLSEGWGQSWGIFLAARASLEELRRHLRRFLRVKTEDDQTLLFRFYDPRVLRVYLPTCTAGELSTFFGPVGAFAMESEAPQKLVSFRRSGAGFGARYVALPDAAS